MNNHHHLLRVMIRPTMTEGDRALIYLTHTQTVTAAARALGTTRHKAQKRIDQAQQRVTAALWIEGKNTPEGFYFTERGIGRANGIDACATALQALPLTPSQPVSYPANTTAKGTPAQD